jgi:hypothetical protein
MVLHLFCISAVTVPFFLLPPGTPSLTHASFNDQMKAITRLFPLDPARVRSQSLRAGAATQLAGAGVPAYVIKNFDNWSSDAFLGYVRASTNIYSNVHTILAEFSTFSAHFTMVVGPSGSHTHVPILNPAFLISKFKKKIHHSLFLFQKKRKKKKGEGQSLSPKFHL